MIFITLNKVGATMPKRKGEFKKEKINIYSLFINSNDAYFPDTDSNEFEGNSQPELSLFGIEKKRVFRKEDTFISR